MDLTRQKDHASHIRGLFDHIPHNRWMILPFVSKAKPPPSIDGLEKISKSTCSCDETILHLLNEIGLVKLSYSKETNALSRIIYVQDKAMWNVICSNGSFTIDLAVYRTYKYICLYNPKSSSHKNHSVSDVHAGNIVYSQLAMRSRIRII